MRISFKDAVECYGEIHFANRTWPRETEFMKLYKLPEELCFPNWIGSISLLPVKRLYCNRDMYPALLAALYDLKAKNLQGELKTFDGLFNIRMVRGTQDKPSAHAYGLAIDINAAENPLGGPVALSPQFVKCFTDAGFTWGGNFDRVDGQHFSWAWE